MFWNSLMSKVHNLPSFEERDEKDWYTPEEEKALELIRYQLSYMRGDGERKFPILFDELCECEGEGRLHHAIGERCPAIKGPDYKSEYYCLHASYILEGSKVVCGLDPKWQEFFTKHLEIGKYLGTICTEDSCAGVGTFMCENCLRLAFDNYEGDDNPFNKYEDMVKDMNSKEDDIAFDFMRKQLDCHWDINGYGLLKKAANEEDRLEPTIKCPDCGEEIKSAYWEEGPEIDTLWVFEKASIGYSHYGRGAGLSFKYHSSLGIAEDADPYRYIAVSLMIGGQINSRIENKSLSSFQEDA